MLRCSCWCDKATSTGAPAHARTLARCSPTPSAFHSVPLPGHPTSPTLSVVLVLPHLCALLWIPCRHLHHPTQSDSRIEASRMIFSLGPLDKGPLNSKNISPVGAGVAGPPGTLPLTPSPPAAAPRRPPPPRPRPTAATRRARRSSLRSWRAAPSSAPSATTASAAPPPSGRAARARRSCTYIA